MCAPGVIAEALECLSQGDAGAADCLACLRHDPVLAVRVRWLTADPLAPAGFNPATIDVIRALLLAAPVATGPACTGYAAHWRQSITVAHLAQSLALRSGVVDADAAWVAGLAHNLGDYLDVDVATAMQVADWLGGFDADGWLADAVRYHAELLPRGRAAHPLVRIVQLAYLLATRAEAVDSVDVRAALASLQLGAGEAATLLAASRADTHTLAQRYGLADAAVSSGGTGFDRLARLYAGQAAQSALYAHFRRADSADAAFMLLHDALRGLFGIEHACVFAPAANGQLRLAPYLAAPAALGMLAIPVDDGHSALARALARNAPQQFERDEADGALVDAQIARLLGVVHFICQPLALDDGRIGVLLAGDALPGQLASPLWRTLLTEYAETRRRLDRPLPVQETASEAIPRDRVRRAIHEVANPLTIMRNYVNLLSDRLGADSTVQRDLGIIGDEIERVARIVRGIAANDPPEAAAPALELVSVNGIVSELVRMALGTLLAPNKVSVQIDLDPDVPPLPLHKDLLKQVLFNLAKNAVEAMHAGGHLKFASRLVGADGQRRVEIEVADTGPGLPPTIAASLFEPVTSEKGGDHAGLGLAISRGLVERMNGQLSCTSTPQGARFLITLPTLQGGQAPMTTTRYGSM